MTRLSIEAKVGFFVVVGILILAYMSMKIGKLPYGPDQGYDVVGYFVTAEGLVKGVPVEIAGVDVGRVKDIALEGGKAKVTLQINRDDILIGEDSQAAIRTKGVLGDKYVELTLGASDARPLAPGETINKTVSAPNIDALLQEISSIGKDIRMLTGSFSDVLGGPDGKASLKIIVDNLRELAETLNQTVQKNRANIDSTLDNFSLLSQDLKDLSSNNKDALSDIVDNFRQVSEQLREAIAVVSEIAEKINRGEGTIGKLVQEDTTVDTLNETLVALRDIADQINRGEGTIGKLVKEEETVDNLNNTLASINDYLQKEQRFLTFLDYRGEYLFDSSDLKSYLSLRIQPQEDKYYLLGIVDDPAGKVTEKTTTTTDGSTTTTKNTKEVDKDELKFSAQIAKRYYDLGIRGGIFESTGGIAADYYFFADRFVLSLEAFDFDTDEKPHMKFMANYTPFQYLYITGGMDHFASDEGEESLFLGLGLFFSDQDLKTLLSGAPIPN